MYITIKKCTLSSLSSVHLSMSPHDPWSQQKKKKKTSGVRVSAFIPSFYLHPMSVLRFLQLTSGKLEHHSGTGWMQLFISCFLIPPCQLVVDGFWFFRYRSRVSGTCARFRDNNLVHDWKPTYSEKACVISDCPGLWYDQDGSFN